MGGRKKGGCLKSFVITLACFSVIIICGLAAVFGVDIIKGFGEKHIKVPFEEITIQDETLQSNFYYTQLDESGQNVYKEILQGIQKEKKKIYLHHSDTNEIQKIFEYVLNDRPEIFWCDNGGNITQYNIADDEKVEGEEKLRAYGVLEPDYEYTGDERTTRVTEIETAVTECLNGISMEASEYEKLKYVYEYLINSVDYNMESTDNQNIYSVFKNKASVCAGYAKSAKYLLDRLGVQCIYVTGTTLTQPHAWNIVSCDGAYYNFDATWGDPVFLEENDEQTSNINNMIYDYLCCNNEELFKTHELEKSYGITYPECSAMDYNYYVMNGMYYDSYDAGTIKQAMYRDINDKASQTYLKFATEELYQQAHDEVLNSILGDAQQHLMSRYGMNEITTSYQEDETLNKITLYWEYE